MQYTLSMPATAPPRPARRAEAGAAASAAATAAQSAARAGYTDLADACMCGTPGAGFPHGPEETDATRKHVDTNSVFDE